VLLGFQQLDRTNQNVQKLNTLNPRQLIAIACVIGSISCCAIIGMVILGLEGLNTGTATWRNFWHGVVGLDEELT